MDCGDSKAVATLWSTTRRPQCLRRCHGPRTGRPHGLRRLSGLRRLHTLRRLHGGSGGLMDFDSMSCGAPMTGDFMGCARVGCGDITSRGNVTGALLGRRLADARSATGAQHDAPGRPPAARCPTAVGTARCGRTPRNLAPSSGAGSCSASAPTAAARARCRGATPTASSADPAARRAPRTSWRRTSAARSGHLVDAPACPLELGRPHPRPTSARPSHRIAGTGRAAAALTWITCEIVAMHRSPWAAAILWDRRWSPPPVGSPTRYVPVDRRRRPRGPPMTLGSPPRRHPWDRRIP